MALAARTPWRLIVKVTIGGIFIYAGAIKVMDPIGFARDVDNYHILPWAVSVRLAFYLPWLEIFCGLAIFSGLFYRGGLLLLDALISIFIIATIVAKARGLGIEKVLARSRFVEVLEDLMRPPSQPRS